MTSHFSRALIIVSLLGGSAASAQLRFASPVRGGLAAAGNSLGLSKAAGANAPGTEHSIGTFIAAGAASQDGTYPVGTTADWTANASDAVLALPSGSRVVYAELIWGGSYQYGAEDVSSALDTSVDLGCGADSLVVAPDATTALTLALTTTFAVRDYVRSAEVTEFVAEHGAATYRVGGVPATQADAIDSLNAAGWSLLVVYEDQSLPFRYVALRTDGGYVDENTSVDHSYDGFCTPASGALSGRALAVALEGDASSTGDSLAAGASAGSLGSLSSPNNPVNNFFASQIDAIDGTLDTSGTFGSANHDAVLGTNVVGGRQGWDLAATQLIAPELTNDQTTLLLRAQSTGDSYVLAASAIELPVLGPRFDVTGTSTLAEDDLEVGENTTLTVTLDNGSGTADAPEVVLRVPLPAGLELNGFAIDGIDGDAAHATVSAADLTSGVELGDVPAGASRVVTIELEPTHARTFALRPSWTSELVLCVGDDPTQYETVGETAMLEAREPNDGSEQDAGVDRDPGDAGRADSGAGSAGEDAGVPAGGDVDAALVDPERDAGQQPDAGAADASSAGAGSDSSGCGCRLSGSSRRPGAGAIVAALALAASALRLRRTSRRQRRS
jgi:hypothetical protein